MRLPRFSQPIRNITRMIARMIGCCLLLFVACAILDFPRVFFSAREKARGTACLKNMREISTALLQYSQDWDETFPPSTHWADAAALRIINPVVIGRLFHCPDADSSYSYVFNTNLDKIRLERVNQPAATPMLYEGNAIDFNAAGDGITIPVEKRHVGTNIAYADGHVRMVGGLTRIEFLSRVKELNWKNKGVMQNDSTKP